MIQIHQTFLTKDDAEEFVTNYKREYHPAGYGTHLTIEEIDGQWIVRGYRYSFVRLRANMAARKIKRTITLVQLSNRYRVMSLQNALEPPVGQMLTAEEVAAMIDIGWTVNVKEAK